MSEHTLYGRLVDSSYDKYTKEHAKLFFLPSFDNLSKNAENLPLKINFGLTNLGKVTKVVEVDGDLWIWVSTNWRELIDPCCINGKFKELTFSSTFDGDGAIKLECISFVEKKSWPNAAETQAHWMP